MSCMLIGVILAFLGIGFLLTDPWHSEEDEDLFRYEP